MTSSSSSSYISAALNRLQIQFWYQLKSNMSNVDDVKHITVFNRNCGPVVVQLLIGFLGGLVVVFLLLLFNFIFGEALKEENYLPSVINQNKILFLFDILHIIHVVFNNALS